MMIEPGKFGAGAATRQISRWEFQLLEPLVFNDPEHGPLTVPQGFVSDLASVRVLREICRWSALIALAMGVLLAPLQWLAWAFWCVAVIALALYGLVVGYGMRAAILHDWLYVSGLLPRSQCDSVYQRANHSGDGTARWRAWIFYVGVRLGGANHFGPDNK